jgi:hypothetical protein
MLQLLELRLYLSMVLLEVAVLLAQSRFNLFKLLPLLLILLLPEFFFSIYSVNLSLSVIEDLLPVCLKLNLKRTLPFIMRHL